MELGTIAKLAVAAAGAALVTVRQRAAVRRRHAEAAAARARRLEAADCVKLLVGGMMCQGSCANTVRRALLAVPGVLEAEVSFPRKTATVKVDAGTRPETLASAVGDVGFECKVGQVERNPRSKIVQLAVQGMMCQKNCGSSAQRALEQTAGVREATADAKSNSAVAVMGLAADPAKLVEALEAVGFDAQVSRVVETKGPNKNKNKKVGDKPRHACLRGVVGESEMAEAFEGIKKHYHEQQLQEYSRYKNWTQSCYMECHEAWSPQVPITEGLRDCMMPLLDKCKERFAEWYCQLHGLEDVRVVTLNSFITKYVPVEGKDEFGKHVDSAKADGSLILALPTEVEHDWPGLKVWDGPRGADGKVPELTLVLQPGDVCCLDALVWHHGLPITKGERFVAVCFYSCKWKKIAGSA